VKKETNKTYVFGGYVTELWNDPDPRPDWGKFWNLYDKPSIHLSTFCSPRYYFGAIQFL
jgi:hypothetical protein